jgi:ribose 1,5-bisphosphokinase PhnN
MNENRHERFDIRTKLIRSTRTNKNVTDSKCCVVDHSGQFKSAGTLIDRKESSFYDGYSY